MLKVLLLAHCSYYKFSVGWPKSTQNKIDNIKKSMRLLHFSYFENFTFTENFACFENFTFSIQKLLREAEEIKECWAK